MSTVECQLEKLAFTSELFEAATEIAKLQAAGYLGILAAPFPAEAQTIVPFAQALLITVCCSELKVPLLKLQLITFAPF